MSRSTIPCAPLPGHPWFMHAANRLIGPGDPAPRGHPECPHCEGRSVIRWGRIGGRPRYRCKGCRRTFNSLTGTPLAYLKRSDRWAAFRDCMGASLTVRTTAMRIGVHRDTAFRWRHRLLNAIRTTDSPELGGRVEVGETTFLFSEKGRRPLQRPARRHGSPHRWASTPRVWVLVAVDDRARLLYGVAGLRRCTASDVRRTLAPYLRADAVLVARDGPLGAVGGFARGAGLTFRRMPLIDRAFAHAPPATTTWRVEREQRPQGDVVGNVTGCVRQLKAWLRPFRGVASRYLPNYLAWHRAIA